MAVSNRIYVFPSGRSYVHLLLCHAGKESCDCESESGSVVFNNVAKLFYTLSLSNSTFHDRLVLVAMLKPYKYPYPVIFSLPELLLPICDAPGGALLGRILFNEAFFSHHMVGINKSGDYIAKERLWVEYPDSIFFILTDDSIMLLSESESEHQARTKIFEKLTERLHPLYWLFNAEKGIMQEVEDPQKLSAIKTTKVSQERKLKIMKTLRYWNGEVSKEEAEIYDKLFETVHSFHQDLVIKHLPSKEAVLGEPTNNVILFLKLLSLTSKYYFSWMTKLT